MKVDVLKTQGRNSLAEIKINNQILFVMDNFSDFEKEKEFEENEYIIENPEFGYLSLNDDLTWDEMFSINKNHESKLEHKSFWAYNAYGRILSINPIMVEVGPIKLEIGDFIEDERYIGKYIFFIIERLEMY